MAPFKHRLPLLALAAAAAGLVLFVTAPGGPSLSPDSLTYLAAARGILQGQGAVTYEGDPLVLMPPFYPAVLAAISFIFRVDPASAAAPLNALCFAAMVYLAGSYFLHPRPRPGLAAAAGLAVMLMPPLFNVSIRLWSEPLFIVLAMAALNAWRRPSRNGEPAWLIAAVLTALACLTRYLGVALIGAGAIVLLLGPAPDFKRKTTRITIFVLLSGTPLALWAARNRALSGAWFGVRGQSIFGPLLNLKLAGANVIHWHLPAAAFILGGVMILAAWLKTKPAEPGERPLSLRRLQRDGARAAALDLAGPALWFAIIYPVALVASSSLAGVDRIGFRLMAPLYGPLALVIIAAFDLQWRGLKNFYPPRLAAAVALIAPAAWFFHLAWLSLGAGQYAVENRPQDPAAPGPSEIIQHLQDPGNLPRLPAYSNAPQAVYLYAGVHCRSLPIRLHYRSRDRVNDLDQLMGVWPPSGRALIVWFHGLDDPMYFQLPEYLSTVELVSARELEGGGLFVVARKSQDPAGEQIKEESKGDPKP